MKVINIRKQPEYTERAIQYFQSKWASEASKPVYDDSIRRSVVASNPLPVWYLLEDEGEIVGCAGLITNDFISCGDLWPWLCALYIEPAQRGRALGRLLIEQARHDSAAMGFNSLYLCSDHVGYYERYGFTRIGIGYHPWGESSGVFEANTAL
ncbi:GNAT family N-acetyltransferase [Chitiniphilus eburneus]|uniref:GNAT family N-acetyltransferase n=1 Tax=Chitiniphilus eburneus TaxID=2571148 RepID=A0A4U0Q528_9NEIS|nr:GNAT family N-acetyltransferase [Chitiniphilus eburneus]TJZ76257.1 GNAT family N-acetyltransferase [Chitiniphilus eburneus]